MFERKIVDEWISRKGDIVVKTENGDYYKGITTNFFGFQEISEQEVRELLETEEEYCSRMKGQFKDVPEIQKYQTEEEIRSFLSRVYHSMK